MKDQKKTKRQLIDELVEMRQRVAELEAAGTERLQAGEAIEVGEEKYRSLVESTEDSVYSVDKKGTYLFLNKKYQARLDLPEDQVVGKPYGEFHSEKKTREFAEKLKRVFETSGPVQYEHTSERDDHSFLRTLSPVKDQEGQITAVTVISKDITERKRAEEALQESEERFRVAVKGSPIVLWNQDKELRYTWIYNPHPGFKAEETIGKTDEQLLPPDDVARLTEIKRGVLESGVGAREEVRTTIGGEAFFYDLTVEPLCDLAGNIVGVTCVSIDITARKWAEEELHAAEREKESILSSVSELIAYEDSELRIIWANRAAGESVGLSADELVGRHCYEIWQQRSDPCIDCPVLKTLETGGSQHAEMESPDGRVWDIGGHPVRDENGNVIGAVEVTTEVTARKRAEEALRESEKNYRTLMEEAPIGICHVDIKGKITYVNKTILQGTGYSSEELIGKNAFRLGLIPHETLKLLGGRMKEKLMGKPPSPLEIQFKRKDGKWIGLEIRGRLVSKHGVPIGVQIIGEDITERKQAEEALKDSEERYRGLFENSSEFLFTLDLKGNFTNVNQAAVELTGYTRAKLLKMNFKDYTPINNHRELFRAFYNVFKTGKSLKDFPVKAIIKDRTEKYFEVSLSPLKKGDEIIGFQGSSKDITERKLAEERLKESEEHYRALVEAGNQMGEAIVLLQNTDRVEAAHLFANEEWARITGYTPGELREMSYLDLVHPRYRGAVAERLRRRWQGEVLPSPWEIAIVAKDGTEVPTEAAGSPITYRGKSAVVGYIRDITERKQAEEERRKVNQYLESIIDNANVWLDVLDANSNVVIWNKAAEAICGFTREEVIGHDKIWEWLYPDEAYRKEITEGITDVVDKGEVREGMETTIRCKDGSTKIISWNERNLLDEKGVAIGSIALGRDITEKRRAQEAEKLLQAQLYHGQKMESIGTLASGIAHEINNPLMGIINYAELIHDRIQDEKLKEFSDGIIKEGNRVGTIVKNLLSFARQEKETHSPAHISDIIEASLSLIGAVLRNDQITIEQDIPDDLPKIKCRSQQIEQVILNLLTNARDALNRRYEGYHEDKVIKISVRSLEREGEKWIRITVEDHGTGIPQDVSKRVFDPFYSTKPKDKGTGLGLSVSYGIVEEHRGELTVESSLGDYTRFHMELRVDNEWSVKSGDSSLNPDDSAEKDDTYDSQGSDSHRKGAP